MLSNATITAWHKRTGDDDCGEPALALQAGGPWRVAAEEYTRQLKLGRRTVQSSLRVRGRNLPAIAEGDDVEVLLGGVSARLTVLTAGQTPGATLGHETLVLA
jgi:hypothetical protein